MERSLIELLKASSFQQRQAGEYSEIPTGTKLLGLSIQGNTVFLDLSEDFASGGGSNSMIKRVEELENDIHRFNKNYKLRIFIDGKSILI